MKKILIVDDEFDNCETITDAVDSMGLESTFVQDGVKGLVTFLKCQSSSQKIDLIISDIDMPGGYGIDMVKKIRKRFNKVKILMISGKDHEDELNELGNKIDGFMAKPFLPKELIEKIKEILEV